MSQPTDCPWAIYYDAIHIVTVDYGRQEARLYENGGSGDGRLLFKRDEPVAKVSITDPFQLINLAFQYVMSYDVLSQIAETDAITFFDRTGVKEFLDRMVEVTPEADRRGRFEGLSPKFINFVQETVTPSVRKFKATEPAKPANGRRKSVKP